MPVTMFPLKVIDETPLVDSYGENVVEVDNEIVLHTTQGSLDSRISFTCVSLWDSYLVGRDDGAVAVEGHVVKANPTHTRSVSATISDTVGYFVMEVAEDRILPSHPSPRETDKVFRGRVIKNRGRRGGTP